MAKPQARVKFMQEEEEENSLKGLLEEATVINLSKMVQVNSWPDLADATGLPEIIS